MTMDDYISSCTKCRNRNTNCTIHAYADGTISIQFRSQLAITKSYNLIDSDTGRQFATKLRSRSERRHQGSTNLHIEFSIKTGTCTKCRKFAEITNYYLYTTKGGVNVNICNFCEKSHFANINEKLDYIKSTMKKKLGFNPFN